MDPSFLELLQKSRACPVEAHTAECIVGGSSGLWTIHSKQKPVCPMRVRSERFGMVVASEPCKFGFSRQDFSYLAPISSLLFTAAAAYASLASHPLSAVLDRAPQRESSNRPCGSSVQGASRVATGLIQLNRCEPPCTERERKRDRQR